MSGVEDRVSRLREVLAASLDLCARLAGPESRGAAAELRPQIHDTLLRVCHACAAEIAFLDRGAALSAAEIAAAMTPGRYYTVPEVQALLVARARGVVGRRSLRQRLRWMAERGELDRAPIHSGNAAIYRRVS